MPAGGSSYLAPMPMTGRRSFAYHKLKKLPLAPASPPAPSTATTLEHQDHQQQPPPPSAAAIQESYQSYYLALGARALRRRQRPRRLGPRRLRISGLARALRRGAAAAGARVRASVAKVARRLREGRPYIGDLFAGNYMFLQVAPSPTMVAVAGVDDDKQRGFAPFTQYYYAKVGGAKSIMPPPPVAVGGLQLHQRHAARVMYKV